MQRRASSRYGAGKAAVGHTSRQARQLPQWSASAASGGNSRDRKSTRLNSSHLGISYAVFCLKKKKPTADISKETPAITGVVETVRRRQMRQERAPNTARGRGEGKDTGCVQTTRQREEQAGST